MSRLYDLMEEIDELNPNVESYVLTSLAEESFGEKALVSDGKIAFTTKENGFFKAHEAEADAVKESGIPARITPMSPSEISMLFSILERSAICTMVGVVWLAFTVWPSSTTTETTVPSSGAVMRV